MIADVEQKNPDGQAMLISSLNPQSSSKTRSPFEEDVNVSFGRYFFLDTHLIYPFLIFIRCLIVLNFAACYCMA